MNENSAFKWHVTIADREVGRVRRWRDENLLRGRFIIENRTNDKTVVECATEKDREELLSNFSYARSTIWEGLN